eukprot:1050194-Amphidinium_carterae.2
MPLALLSEVSKPTPLSMPLALRWLVDGARVAHMPQLHSKVVQLLLYLFTEGNSDLCSSPGSPTPLVMGPEPIKTASPPSTLGTGLVCRIAVMDCCA